MRFLGTRLGNRCFSSWQSPSHPGDLGPLSKVEATQVYARVSIERLKKIHAATYPAAGLRGIGIRKHEQEAGGGGAGG
jgi:hypothetical protein